jgi:two-component system chemotaxis response regulator CheY
MEELLNMRFLVVDDMFTMRKMMRNTLSSFGIKNVIEAKDGKIAIDLLRLEAAKQTPFHFVISDWNMPEMTGIELLKQCRASEAFKNIGFILVTAESDLTQIEKAKSFDVDEYVQKPVNNDEFKQKLLAIFKKRYSNNK